MEILLHKIDEISAEMIDQIKHMVQIPSVKKEACPNAPYGQGIKQALDEALALGKKMGFEVENVNNQMGIVKYGTGEDYIGIFGHLDVVEIGEGWSHEPFGAEEVNGRIFGRGILDNKGPIFSCLYALYAIKQCNIKLKHPVWIVFGCDEESGFHDVDAYLQSKPAPLMGFTPDCKYPVVYAERGRCAFEVSSTTDDRAFQSFMETYIQKDNGHGNQFGLDIKDEEFGEMVMSKGKLNEQANRVSFTFTYPACITWEEIKQKVETVLHESLICTCLYHWDPVFFEKDSFLCKTLQKAYEQVTGSDGTPVTTTGGTYAKRIPNIVPFGPSFPGQKGIGHRPDEWMDRSDLILNAKIYALGMAWLGSEKYE